MFRRMTDNEVFSLARLAGLKPNRKGVWNAGELFVMIEEMLPGWSVYSWSLRRSTNNIGEGSKDTYGVWVLVDRPFFIRNRESR